MQDLLKRFFSLKNQLMEAEVATINGDKVLADLHAQSAMLQYMAFITYVNNTEYHDVLTQFDNFTRNDIAHCSEVPATQSKTMAKVRQSVRNIYNKLSARA